MATLAACAATAPMIILHNMCSTLRRCAHRAAPRRAGRAVLASEFDNMKELGHAVSTAHDIGRQRNVVRRAMPPGKGSMMSALPS